MPAGDYNAAPADLPPIPASWSVSAWDPKPTLEARVEAVWLQPQFIGTVPLFTEFIPDVNQNVVSSSVTGDLHSRYIAAGRVTGEAHLSVNKSIDGSIFYLNGPDHSAMLGARDGTKFLTTANGGFFNNLAAGFPTVADFAQIHWAFENWGADASYLHHWVPLKGPVNDFAIGLGARGMFIDERTTLTFINELDPSQGDLRAKSENLLLGPQLMARVRIQSPLARLRAVAEIKFGLMTNATETRTFIFVDGVQLATGSYNRTQFSPIVEGNFLLEYLVTNHLSVFGGFQTLYVGRVDRAARQITQNQAQFVTRHENIDDLWMYGPQAGILIHY